MNLQLSEISNLVNLHIAFLNCQPGLVFQLHREMTSFTENQSVWGHPKGGLVCGAVGPESIIKMNTPILSIGCHCFLKDPLNLPIGHFSLPISLRVIGGGDSLGDTIFLQKCAHRL